MRVSKLAKNMLKYLPVFVMLIATVIGLFIGKNLDPTTFDSQPKTPAHLPTEPNSPQPLIILGAEAEGPCSFSNIYTSLPPKCKTLDGKYIRLPGIFLHIPVTPEDK